MSKLTIPVDEKPEMIETELDSIAFSQEHYITGRTVKWTYCKEDCLTVNRQIVTRPREVIIDYTLNGCSKPLLGHPAGFHCFIYSESATEDILSFRFENSSGICLSFEYQINFSGWKEINLVYERGFMKGRYAEDMDRFRIVPVRLNAPANTVFLDELCLCQTISPLHTYPAMCGQVIGLERHSKRQTAWTREIEGIQLNRPVFLTPDEITEDQKQAFVQITENYLKLSGEMDLPPFAVSQISPEEFLRFYESCHFRYENNIITGTHIKDSTVFIRMMNALARSYILQPSEPQEEMFLCMYRHIRDQNTAVNWYNGRGLATAFLLLKDMFRQRGLLPEAVRYLKSAYEFNKIYDVTSKAGVAGARFEDSDAVGMELPSLLACILLMEDSPEKLRDMTHFLYYLENFCLGYAPGIASGCKPDGTVFHHGSYVRQYAIVANYSMARILSILSDTPFMIKEEAAGRFRKILETEYMTYQGAYESFCLTQYFFDSKKSTGVFEFAHLANALHDDSLASMYMTLAKTSTQEMNTPYYKKFLEKGIKSAPLPSGHKTLTYSAAAVHRRDNWIATVRGHSQYVTPMEIWPDEIGCGSRYSAFSMYRSYGFLELARHPETDCGTDNGMQIEQGFDFRRWNGATAVCLPYSDIKSKPLNVDDELAEWLLSDQAFAGGLDDSTGNGVFAVNLHGHQKYGMESFYASKSYHFYEDVIVCIGSGISDGHEEYETETTLFQDYGEGAIREGTMLADNRNNGYYLWSDDNLKFYEKNNQSRDVKDQADTFGVRTFALLNHGEAPMDSGYQYLIRIGKGIEGLKQLDISENVTVIRRDKYAHIVRIFNRTNYVLFRKEYELHDDCLDSVTESCLISVIEQEDGTLHLCVCDPDLRFYHGETNDYDLYRNQKEQAIYAREWTYNRSMPSTVWVTVNRRVEDLEVIAGNARIIQNSDSKTILEFICADGFTNEVKLC